MSLSQLKRYKKIKYLGKGSHGAAILVETRDSNSLDKEGQHRLLVMKEIIIGHLSEQEQKSAKMEAELLRQMSHQNIVACVESFVESSKLYIIMEYADGGDIGAAVQKMISANTVFTEEQILHIFSQITFAMKYVHDSNILHRDLKSQNIFLMNDGRVKLGDFGIAKVLDKTDDQAQTQIGTPYYLSPELCESSPYGRPSDIWALGIVLYEMMTLELPFQAKSIPALIHKICSLEPSFAKAEAAYSPELVRLLKNILQKDPDKRPTVKEIARSAILKDFGNTALKGSIFKKVPFAVVTGSDNDNGGSNNNCSSSGVTQKLNMFELESALPHHYGFNDIISPHKSKRDCRSCTSDDNVSERNEKLEKLKQFRLQIGRNNKLPNNVDALSVIRDKNIISRKVEKSADGSIHNCDVLVSSPQDRHATAMDNASSPQLRPKSLAEVQAERRAVSSNDHIINNGGYNGNSSSSNNKNCNHLDPKSPSSILYPQGNDYESVIKRNFFANRATALAVKAKVEAMERGSVDGDEDHSTYSLNKVVSKANNNIIHPHKHFSTKDNDNYYSAESRIAAIKAHKERERLHQLQERERQIQLEHEINRSSRRNMKDIKGVAFDINLSSK